MTLEIGLTFAVLIVAVILFITEVIRPDLTGLLVLFTLVVLKLVSPEQAVSGFANPAVIAIWSMFILSAGLAHTGVASYLGRQVTRMAGESERRLQAVLINVAAGMALFMNNIGVAAILMPVTIDASRRTKRVASRLLLPMVYGATLGGMIILFSTSSNLVISGVVEDAGYPSLGIFDLAPVGILILLVVQVYFVSIGHRLLPYRQSPQPLAGNGSNRQQPLQQQYGLEERLALLVLPDDCLLAGKTLAESRISRALGLNILSVRRKDKTRLAPEANLLLEGGDQLQVLGKLDQIESIIRSPMFIVEDRQPTVQRLMAENIGFAEIEISPDSPFAGDTLANSEFRQEYGLNVLAIWRGDSMMRSNLQNLELNAGDRLLLEGQTEKLAALSSLDGYRTLKADEIEHSYRLEERLLLAQVPKNSILAEKSLAEARLGSSYGITVLEIIRPGEEILFPSPEMELKANDQLIVAGSPEDIEVLSGLQQVQIQKEVKFNLAEMENEAFSFVEVILSPYTTLAGKTLKQLHFREKYDVSVLAIWHGHRPYRTDLPNLPLQLGDGLLCYGPREAFERLATERDFIVLRQDVQVKPRLKKAPLAALIMTAVVLAVLVGWLPISIAAIGGAALMVLSGCLTMDEAHKAINWKSIFLIATMLPLGFAMRDTGAAEFLAQGVLSIAGPYGNMAVMGGLMALTLIINPFIPSVVNAVVMTPIALAAAAGLGASHLPFVIGVVYMVAASFMTPLSHPANLLVMSPGGYRFSDYLKSGIPVSILVWIVALVAIPFVFPF